MATRGGHRLKVILALFWFPAIAIAAEYQQLENLADETAETASVGLNAINETPEKRPARELLRDAFADSPPFWRDSSLDLGVRVYDFQRENGTESIAEAFAAGTELTFRSGKWRERLSLVLSWHTSTAIDASEELGRTGLLAPDQSDLSVISRAYLQYDFGDIVSFRGYRQDFNLPYLNRQDSRMIPNTHEAFVLRRTTERQEWILGHVSKMKRRDSEEFIPMAEIAGVAGDNSGTSVAGAQYDFANDLEIGALVQHTNDLFTTTYSETSYRRTLTEDWGLQVAAQLTNQWSTGSEELGKFSTYHWGLRGKVSFRGAVLTAAYTEAGNAEPRKPFGGTPGFTTSMLFDFDRAHEEAYRIGLSQNFITYGLPGVSLIVNYTKGRHARAIDGSPLPDTDVISVTADYRPREGWLKGLWLRVRYADGDRGSPAADRRDVRIILNYSLGALQ